jgi:ABC-type transport system involved in multi-copper enzyme maturation permease subunit
MFQRIIDGISASTGTTIRLTSLAAGAAFALFITTCFLCAAAFISVLQTYGPVQACLAGAGIFFLLTLTAAATYWGYKRQMQKRARIAAERAAKSAASSMLADPMLIATGLQIVRAIGIKRLLPILAIGGVALGIMASRAGAPDEAAAEPAE